MKNKVSVIICTFNRAEYLKYCLDSFNLFAKDFFNKIEILVIDNNSTDNTKDVFENFSSLGVFDSKYIFESNIGLSYARNTGANEAKYDWLFYLDDDAFIVDTTISVLLDAVSQNKFTFFGGVYKAYYSETKPKWLNDIFGTKITAIKEFDTIPEGEIIVGLIMVIHKTTFNLLGEFNLDLGMKGKLIGYHEETDLQYKAKEKGIKLGLHPQFWVYHHVGVHKHNITFHLKARYAVGRDQAIRNGKLNLEYFRIFLLLPFRVVKYFLKFVFTRNYYIENFLWDSFIGVALHLGYIKGRYLRTTKKLNSKK